MRWAGSPRAAHISVKRSSSVRATTTTARPADSLNRKVNGSMPSGTQQRAPMPDRSAISTSAWPTPPSLHVVRGAEHAVARAGHEDLAEQSLALQVDDGRQPAEVAVHVVRPLAAGELVAGVAQQVDQLAVELPADRRAPLDVVDHAEHADHRRRQDRRVAGLVVEGDVAAGDRDAELEAAVGKAGRGLRELPHHLGVLRASRS